MMRYCMLAAVVTLVVGGALYRATVQYLDLHR
jgi:hypothetical protein